MGAPVNPRDYGVEYYLGLLAILMHKLNQPHVVISHEDLAAFQRDQAAVGESYVVLINETQNGSADLRLITESGAVTLMARHARDGHL